MYYKSAFSISEFSSGILVTNPADSLHEGGMESPGPLKLLTWISGVDGFHEWPWAAWWRRVSSFVLFLIDSQNLSSLQ